MRRKGSLSDDKHFSIWQQTLAQWRIAFLITAGLMLFETVFYLFFGSGEEQPWNRPPSPDQEEKETSEYDNASFNVKERSEWLEINTPRLISATNLTNTSYPFTPLFHALRF